MTTGDNPDYKNDVNIKWASNWITANNLLPLAGTELLKEDKVTLATETPQEFITVMNGDYQPAWQFAAEPTIAFQIADSTPKTLQIMDDFKPIVTVNLSDGTVEFAEGANLTRAFEIFWSSMAAEYTDFLEWKREKNSTHSEYNQFLAWKHYARPIVQPEQEIPSPNRPIKE